MAPKRSLPESGPYSIFELDRLCAQPEVGETAAVKILKFVLQHGLADDDLSLIPHLRLGVPQRAYDFVRTGCFVHSAKIVERLESGRGDTTKLLIELRDGHRVETVVMRHANRSTVCVSSQIGCQMGCKFCAVSYPLTAHCFIMPCLDASQTGTMGIIGNLTAGEIIEQVVFASRLTSVRNVVFMGMGEPLNNYANVRVALRFLVSDKLMALSARHVSVSTVGVLQGMRRLTEEMPEVNLALSLHAPNQEVRKKIVPAAAGCHIDSLMAAVDAHVAANPFARASAESLESTSQRRIVGVMIEYILIKDVNDRPEHAHELGQLLRSRRGHILLNLIPYNPTEVCEAFEAPSKEDIDRFFGILVAEPYRIVTRVRREMGQDIAGACGQLALVNPADKPRLRDIEDAVAESAVKDKARREAGAKRTASSSPSYASMVQLAVASALLIGATSVVLRLLRKHS